MCNKLFEPMFPGVSIPNKSTTYGIVQNKKKIGPLVNWKQKKAHCIEWRHYTSTESSGCKILELLLNAHLKSL